MKKSLLILVLVLAFIYVIVKNFSTSHDDYSKYLIELSPNLYAGLDVIGDPIKTLQNNKYMEQKYKLSPIPTFHMGEDIKHLDRFLAYYLEKRKDRLF